MFLLNPAGAIDLGRNDVFAKGEIREFSDQDAQALMNRYPALQVASSTGGALLTAPPKRRGRRPKN